MDLVTLRQKFVELSGRYDLVIDTSAWADNGANFYINNGMQMLSKMAQGHSDEARLFFPLASGEYSLTFQNKCRVIKEVWINDSSNRWELTKIDLNVLKSEYDSLASGTSNESPSHYAIASLRALETTNRDSLGVFIDKTWDEDDTNYDYRGVIIIPPADGDYVVEVNGLFKNIDLSANGDENFWTIEEYDLLLRAALYKLEGMSRGTENAKNWLSAIKDDVKEINFDIAEEESYKITQLKG